MKITWLPLAQEDLDKIYDFIADKGEMSAINVYNEILDGVEPLKEFPQMAQIESLLSDQRETFRSLIIREIYKVIYYIENETVFIVSVWDCRQNPKKLKNKLKEK